LTIILLEESIEFITCEGAHISKILTIHDYKRRSKDSSNCHIITRLILADKNDYSSLYNCRILHEYLYMYV